MNNLTILTGDCIEQMKTLADNSVQCVVTSPPYWGLRDYGVAGQIGLEKTPEEYIAKMVEVFQEVKRILREDGTLWLNLGDSYAGSGKCRGSGGSGPSSGKQTTNAGAYFEPQTELTPDGLKPKDLCLIPHRVAKALQEPYYTGTIKNETDRAWLAAMIEAEGCLFIHKRKAGTPSYSTYEKKDGTISEYNRTQDTYGAGLEVASTDRILMERCMQIAGIGSICEQSPDANPRRMQTIYRWNVRSNECRWIIAELYPHFIAKQLEARLLLGCPSSGPDAEKAHESLKAVHQGGTATIDFPAPQSLFEPGWYVRSDVIWAKRNCMPESVTDRPTKAHEYIFLLTKSAKYYYDAEAVKETGASRETYFGSDNYNKGSGRNDSGRYNDKVCNTRNLRSVWDITTKGYPGAHFATFPPELPERCIKAGTSEKGCCSKCGMPWERVVERGNLVSDAGYENTHRTGKKNFAADKTVRGSDMLNRGIQPNAHFENKTTGWSPGCKCNADVIPCTVLDPFGGSGTTAMVARNLGRKAITIELNEKYIKLIEKRNHEGILF